MEVVSIPTTTYTYSFNMNREELEYILAALTVASATGNSLYGENLVDAIVDGAEFQDESAQRFFVCSPENIIVDQKGKDF